MASHCLLPPESVSALHEAWKGNTLTRSILRDYSSARLDSFFESRGLARDAVLLFSLLSPGCKFLESPRFPGTPVASGFSSSCVSLAPVSAHSVPGTGVSASLPDSSSSLPSGGSSPLCPGSESHVPQFPFQRVLRVTPDCRGLYVVQHLWTLSRVFHSLRYLMDLRARRRRESFHWSADGRAGHSYTGNPGRYWRAGIDHGVSGSRLHPHGGRPGGFDGNGCRSSPAVSPCVERLELTRQVVVQGVF